MGLDMYLTGRRDLFDTKSKRGEKNAEEYDLGYLRKHPNLHGYIINEFADGVDDCREIELSADRIRQIIKAIRNRDLPETTGFFFGTSDDTEEQIAEDIRILEDALKWLEGEEPRFCRSLSYRASW